MRYSVFVLYLDIKKQDTYFKSFNRLMLETLC